MPSPGKALPEPASKPDDAEGDSRTLWVDFDAQDREFNPGRVFVTRGIRSLFDLEEVQWPSRSTPLQAHVAERKRSSQAVQ